MTANLHLHADTPAQANLASTSSPSGSFGSQAPLGKVISAPTLVSNTDTGAPETQTVPIKLGDHKTAAIKVQKQKDPFASLTKEERNIFSRESTFANKQFATNKAEFSKSDMAFQKSSFQAKPFFSNDDSGTNTTTANLNTKVPTQATAAYNQHVSGFDKNFATSGSDSAQNKKTLFNSSTSDYQGRTASFDATKSTPLSTSTLAQKQYLGPGAQKVPEGVEIKENTVLTRMSALPDRPLTIDEVRNLINHEVKPDADAKPESESKPLNDPDYTPPVSPEPPSRASSHSSSSDDDDPIPSPGAMANPQPPENSEPLPR